jgi:hypothetical protein
MLSLYGRFVVGSQVSLDFLEMIVGIGQGVMNIGRFQAWVLLYNFLNAHPQPVTHENCGYANTGTNHHGLTSAARRTLFNIPVIQLGHGLESYGTVCSVVRISGNSTTPSRFRRFLQSKGKRLPCASYGYCPRLDQVGFQDHRTLGGFLPPWWQSSLL